MSLTQQHSAVAQSVRCNFDSGLTLNLNNASRSPLPLSHQVLCQQYMEEWRTGNHDPYYYNFQHADCLKQELSQYIQAPPANMSIQQNVAQSMSLILNGLNWQSGDRVLLIEGDYPSITLPFHTNNNIAIDWLPTNNGKVCPNKIVSKITAKTKAIAISWVCKTTGQVQDMDAISALCKKHNIYCIVDATQALGAIPINLSATHVDFFTASLYKWCFSAHGTCISIMSDSLLRKLHPISAGLFSQADRQITSTPYVPTSTATKFEYGNLNTIGIICGHESFKWFNALGGAYATHPLLTHVSQGIIALLKEKGYMLAVNYDADHASGIVSFIHPNPTDFMERLTHAGGMATHRDGFIRLSPGIYQSDDTLTALDALL